MSQPPPPSDLKQQVEILKSQGYKPSTDPNDLLSLFRTHPSNSNMVCQTRDAGNPADIMCFDKSLMLQNLKSVDYDGLLCRDIVGKDGTTKIGRDCQYFH